MQPDNVFRIGSITKQFTAIAILQLMEQGKLNLQDEITRFIPDYPTQGNKITIENLLTHTSGIQSYTGMKDFMKRRMLDLKPEEMIDHFKNEPMHFAPGTDWKYSNSGYFLLGYIIEKASGKSYADYIEENIFKPLNMNNSLYGSDSKIVLNRAAGYSKDENGFLNAKQMSMTQPYSAGAIQSTAEDLFKWNQGVHSYKLVKKETLEKAFTNYKLSTGKQTQYGYGYQFANIQNSRTIEHGGAINGFMSMMMYLPKEDVFVAVLTNCEAENPEDITSRLAAIAIGEPYEYQEAAQEKYSPQDYTGVFENEKGEYRVFTVSENSLYSQRGRNPKFKIKAYQKDKFFFDNAILTIDFIRNKNGEVDKLITRNRDGQEVWNKTNKPIPAMNETKIKVDEKVLQKYVGEYEITPQFSFAVTKVEDRLFLQATGQEKVEIFPENENKFFLKVNDARLEFVSGPDGTVSKSILFQNGKTIDAKKIK